MSQEDWWTILKHPEVLNMSKKQIRIWVRVNEHNAGSDLVVMKDTCFTMQAQILS